MTTITVLSSTDCVAHALWNGSTNDPPPTDWMQPTYSEVGWPSATVVHSVGAPSSPLTDGSEPIWAYDGALSLSDAALFRHHFTLPVGTITSASISPFAPLDGVWINGFLIAGTPGANRPRQTFSVPITVFNDTGDNVLAIAAHNDGTALPGQAVWLVYVLTIDIAVEASSGITTPLSPSPAFRGGELGDVIRVRHRLGHIGWEHDGQSFRVLSNDAGVLETPFPTLTRDPDALLGRDPISGLPMWTAPVSAPPPPPPPPVSHSYGQQDSSLQDTTGAPIPLPTPPTPQRVCGAADQMATLAVTIYDAVCIIINKAKNNILTDFTQDLKAELTAELVSLLTEGEFAQWVIAAVQIGLTVLAAIVEVLISYFLSLPSIKVPTPLLPDGTSPYSIIRCGAFSALWLTGGDYLSRNKSADGMGTKDYWKQQIAPAWNFFAGSTVFGISETNPPWQLVWLNSIIDNVSDGGWALAASIGAQKPSTRCTTCPGYP